MSAVTDEMRDCELCGLPVDRDDFRIHTPGRILHFCCDGCQGIYRLLHQPEELAEGQITENADE